MRDGCTLKAVVTCFVIGPSPRVKRTHKGSSRGILAENMRRIRAERQLSQEQLAFESGLNRTYLSAVERAERNVSIDNVERIARGLRIDVWLLLKPDGS